MFNNKQKTICIEFERTCREGEKKEKNYASRWNEIRLYGIITGALCGREIGKKAKQ